jgi:hypothetical protein
LELRWVARDDALAGLAAAAEDPGWRTRAQCAEDATWLRDAPAVEALVALVGDKCTRVAAAAHRGLQQVSGKDVGRDADLWKAWWEANRAGWKAPQGDLRRDAPDDPKRTTVRYHGVEVAADSAVFVVDASGSMRQPVGEKDAKTRWEVATAELSATVKALPDSFVANVVFFQVEPRAAFGRPLALTPKARRDAANFADDTSPAHAGNLLAAVLLALEGEGTDTVYLLSDGAPSAGDMVDKGRVRAAVRQRNRTAKRAIHAIGFGVLKATERGFLEGVAKDSGGRAVFRGQ